MRIHAYDAIQNHSFTEIEVTFNNSPIISNDIEPKIPIIYPNPNTGHFNIKTNGINISQGEIYNSLGQLIIDFETVHTEEKEILIHGAGYILYKIVWNGQPSNRKSKSGCQELKLETVSIQ